MKKRLVQVPAVLPWDDEQTVPDDLIGRLYGASKSAVADIMAGYSSGQRANLAMFFYRKAHLRPIGLAIAATCDFSTLVLVWGPARGQALFDQSHDCAPAPAPKRPKITLAKFPTFHLPPVTAAPPDEEAIDRIAA
jgi:hypothetical protein